LFARCSVHALHSHRALGGAELAIVHLVAANTPKT
jgi:hypothetical protein